MAAAFNLMQGGIGRAAAALDGAREALRRSRGDLEYLASHDSLTALPNRRHMEQEIERVIEQCTAAGQRCAVVALDLDGFKFVNDSRGHNVGDHVLSHVARLFRTLLRASDYIGRLGGDEFAAVLPGHHRRRGAAGRAPAAARPAGRDDLTRRRTRPCTSPPVPG